MNSILQLLLFKLIEEIVFTSLSFVSFIANVLHSLFLPSQDFMVIVVLLIKPLLSSVEMLCFFFPEESSGMNQNGGSLEMRNRM